MSNIIGVDIMGNYKVNTASLEAIKNNNNTNNNSNSTDKNVKKKFERKITKIRKCTFTILENGNVLPILYFDPIEISGITRTSAMISSWLEFDRLCPRIGSLVSVSGSTDFISVYSMERMSKKDTIERPDECPICSKPLWTNESGTIMRCINDECGLYDMCRIFRYYMFCCLDLNIKFRHIITLYKTDKLKHIKDIYDLTKDDYIRIGISENTAEKICNNVKTNLKIPIQTLYYSIMGSCLPVHAIKLSSLVTDKYEWYAPISVITNTNFIATNEKGAEEDKLGLMQNVLNSELTKHSDEYEELADIIDVMLLPNKLPLTGKAFVLADLSRMSKRYAETVIRLNDGRVEDNFRKITWGRINFILGGYKFMEKYKNIIDGLNRGVEQITEDEFRSLVDMKLAKKDSEKPDSEKNEGEELVDQDPPMDNCTDPEENEDDYGE